MKLYEVLNGMTGFSQGFHPTQAAARAALADLKANLSIEWGEGYEAEIAKCCFRKADVPTDKPGLIAFLNRRIA